MQAKLSFLLGILFFVSTGVGMAGGNIGNNDNKTIETNTAEVVKTRKQLFDNYILNLYNDIDIAKYNLAYDVFRKGVVGFVNLKAKERLNSKNIITIIDFTKSSREKRFYVIDLAKRKVLYHTLVAHGAKSGGDYATSFSNNYGSHQSSIGFYVTGETYVGSKGFSLRLDGMDKGYNDRMRERAVVIHGAKYVSESIAKSQNRLGRSWGCPALPTHLNKEIINLIKDKTVIFAYYDDAKYLTQSVNLNENSAVNNYISATA